MKATILFIIFLLPLTIKTQPTIFGFRYKCGIVSFGYKMDKTSFKIIEKRLWSTYRLKSSYVGMDSFIPYNSATSYNNELKKFKDKKYQKVVGVTPTTVWSSFYFDEFPVYGSTNVDKQVSIVSTYQIDPDESVDDTTTANIVVHETGHQFGLDDCEDTLCVMTGYGRLRNCCLCLKCRAMFLGLARFYKPKK